MTARAHIAGRIDLVLVAVLALAAAAVVVLAPGLMPLRAILGLPLVLVLPGYAVMAALFGDERPRPPMLIVVSLALSVALTIVAALLLYVAGQALTARSFVLSLAGISLAAAAGAALRQRGRAPQPFPSLAPLRPWGVPLVICGVVFAGAFAVLGSPLPNPHVEGYTALAAQRITPSQIRLSISNQEQAAQRYHVQALSYDRTDGYQVVARADHTLKPGERWRYGFRTSPADQAKPVKVRLYRASAPGAIYRNVYLRP